MKIGILSGRPLRLGRFFSARRAPHMEKTVYFSSYLGSQDEFAQYWIL